MSSWPLYRENILQGPSHVSLSLPGKPSNISKSVGGNSPALLLIPNLDYLQSFVKGNVGIGDSAIKGMLATNLNSPIASSQEKVAESFAKNNNLDIDLEKYKSAAGKIRIPTAEIPVPPAFDYNGIKALEKTIMTSIFETQKPFIDITKNILGVMVNAEDIVARVMPVLSINPLTSKSEKPIVKDGSVNGTKAIGFQNGIEFKKVLAELEKILKTGTPLSVSGDGSFSRDLSNKPESSSGPDSPQTMPDKKWKILSIVYSTGSFDPSVNYKYIYNILPPDDDFGTIAPPPIDQTPLNDNPYDKYKPKRLIFGIFDSKGTPLNPRDSVKAISIDGTQVSSKETNFKKAEWVINSPKWRFRDEDYIWPSFSSGSGEPIFLWEGPFGVTRESKTSPGDKWSIKKYKNGDKNILNNVDAVEGDPYIVGFDASDTGEFKAYFTDYLKAKAKPSKEATQEEKDLLIKDLMGKLDIQSHLQNVYLYGSGNGSVYNEPGFPSAIKRAFKPYQIIVDEAKSDPDLPGDGLVWIDPEADYEFKIIRVDPIGKIGYRSAKGEPKIDASIKSFVKNSAVFVFSDGKEFDISVSRNGVQVYSQVGTSRYTLDNWNWDGSAIDNLATYSIRISRGGSVILDKDYGAGDFPDIGKSRTFTLTSSGNVSTSDENVPLYSIRVSNSNDGNEVLIRPDSLANDFLSTPELFSNGRYGSGTKESPQDIDIIKRYAMTDLDTESYYIIEGILVSENETRAQGEDGSRWYRIPHALGVMIPFLKMMLELGLKLFPNITKLLKLFKDPTKLVTDIITEKLGDSFGIFSKESMEKFKKAKDIIGKKNEIIEKAGPGEYSRQMKANFKESPLAGHVHVDEYSISNPGKAKFVLDGTAMIPFEIFGISLPFGMELKMSNLIPDTPNISVPKVEIKGDMPKIPDPNIKVPESLDGISNSSLPSVSVPKVEAPKVEIPNVGIPSISLPKVQSPFRLITGKIGKAKTKDCDGTGIQTPDSGLSNSDYLNNLNSQNGEGGNGGKSTKSPNNVYEESIWYSTGRYIQGVDYNYIYVKEDTAALLREIDELVPPGPPKGMGNGTGSIESESTLDALPEDLMLAKEKLTTALAKDPTNPALKEKLKEINDKILASMNATQPILKLVMGLVTTPIKVVSCIVQWIFDFFKSLVNPMMLPSKLIEFVSFKWIQKFFGAQGLLKTAGINFNPAVAKEWASMATMPNGQLPVSVPNSQINVDLNSVSSNVPGKVDLKGGFPVNKDEILKRIPPHSGNYALPDDFPLADMQKFLNISFMSSLPTYTAKDIRENPDIPFQIQLPVRCLTEKLINSFIDMVWSLLGIEVIIPPPHIKMCTDRSPEEANRLLNGDTKQDATDATEVVSTNPYEEKPISDSFVYEVTYPDGRKEIFKDYDSLQKYMVANQTTNFDVRF
jgi:hypothetical protein